MHHPKLEFWEKHLVKLINELDDFLEEKYKGEFKLHPARRKRGKTVSKAQDGLFNIAANFSLGIGSKFGRGYVVDVHLATLEKVPSEIQKKIIEDALLKINDLLPKYFPGKKLNVDRDGKVIKIYGDLSLGKV